MTSNNIDRLFWVVFGMAFGFAVLHGLYLWSVLATEPRTTSWFLIAQAPSLGIVAIGVLFHIVFGHQGRRAQRWAARMSAVAFTMMLLSLPALMNHDLALASLTLAISTAVVLQDQRVVFFPAAQFIPIFPILQILIAGRPPMTWWTPLEAVMVTVYALGCIAIPRPMSERGTRHDK
jgi:hypothetical protein